MRTAHVHLLTALFGLCLSLVGALSVSAQSDSQVTRRFALIVGANNGGRERAVLRYAQRDARAVSAVLEQLGGVEQNDRVLLLEPSPSDLSAALNGLRDRASAARQGGQRTELLFYYSGHSDERGLLLGEARVPYRDVREGLVAVGTAVHVGVLDSCASGALTRLKGGKRRAPFLLDSSNAVQGHAFLTSSSADEGAQESDRVGASFFTHYLVSGLRGAADFSGDGRVTLNEAYRFAFDETLARTEDTSAGPQHAAYDIQLVGTGDLVMTDLRQTGAALHIPKGLAGRMYLRDTRGNLVVELNKPQGRVIELALEAQTYVILLDQEGKLSRASVTLAPNTTTELRANAFVVVEGERNRLRGDPRAEPVVASEYRTVGFGIGIVPPLSTNEMFGRATRDARVGIRNHASLHFGWGRAHLLEGVGVTFGLGQVHERVEGVQVAIGANFTRELKGAQVAVGLNVADSVDGAQVAAGVSFARGHVEGVQVGLGNLARSNKGAQISLANVVKESTGAQLGLANGASTITGLQVGLGNGAVRFDGLQLGLGNFAFDPHAHGAQVGLFNANTGRLQGFQLGLFNYADRASGQFGLISVTREGGVHPLAFTTDVMPLQAGLRFDADYTYSTLIVGLAPESGKDTYSGGFGFGGKIPLKLAHLPSKHKLWLEPEVSHQTLVFDGTFAKTNPSTLSRLSLQARYQIHAHLSAFIGPSVSVLVHAERDYHDRRPGYLHSSTELTNGKGKTQVLRTLGFVLGVAL